MVNTGMAILAAVLLVVVLHAERRGNRPLLVSSKTVLSALFVVAALVQSHSVPAYSLALLGGLCLCLVGDVCLAFPSRQMFLAGLVSFLLGHLLYILAFLQVGRMCVWTWIGALVTCGTSAVIYLWLQPYLGKMKGPVVLYILVISTMVVSAVSVQGGARPGTAVKWAVAAGGVCFYLSDIFVARDRFVREEFLNRLIGLPMYYAAQFTLAFSSGL